MSTTHKPLALESDFALLDVKRSRGALFKALGFTRNDGPAPIPVTITGFLIGAWGNDDGTSQEFEVEVTEVKTS